MWSIGMTYFTQAPDAKTLIRKVSTHPCILSVVAGLLIMVLQIPLPGFISLTIKNIAGGNTFLAMALVGTILAEVPASDAPGKRYDLLQLYTSLFYSISGLAGGVTLHRLTICYRCLSCFVQVACCQCAPAVLAAKYGKDEVFATKCVVLSTLLSMITVPVWCMFLA